MNQYGRMIKWLKSEAPKEPAAALGFAEDLLEILTRKLTFVHLNLTDASVATKIFERLNYRGIKVGVFGLVRNEVFSRVSQDLTASMEIHENLWRPFEAKFQSKEDGFFFPYCLIHNSNLKKIRIICSVKNYMGNAFS